MRIFAVFEDFLQSHCIKKHCIVQISRVRTDLTTEERNKINVSEIFFFFFFSRMNG